MGKYVFVVLAKNAFSRSWWKKCVFIFVSKEIILSLCLKFVYYINGIMDIILSLSPSKWFKLVQVGGL